MNLEIAKYILSSYKSYYESHLEMIGDYIEDGSLDPDVDAEDLAWGNAYDTLEGIIYDDLEYEFEFPCPDLSLGELIHLAEETLDNT